MKAHTRALLIAAVLSVTLFASASALARSDAPGSASPDVLTCSPTPCALPPTEASEGGGIVTNPVIVTDPANAENLLLGSFDANCGPPSFAGFHLSANAGSTWKRIWCSPVIHLKGGLRL